MADRFMRFVLKTAKRLVDMGDGSHAELVVTKQLAGDTMSVTVDEPLDVNVQGTVPVSLAAAIHAIIDNAVSINGTVPVSVAAALHVIVDNAVTVNVNGTVPVSVAAALHAIIDNVVPVTLPANLITGTTRPRLRVDPGQTGFFEGRMFRAFFNGIILKAGPSVQFRFTSPVNFILWTQVLELTQGALQLEIYTGATPSGTWVSVPVIGLNRMTEVPLPTYAAQVTVETSVGGTGNFTGGTRVDLIQNRTASTNGTASNVGQEFSERGLPAGVYYGRLQTLPGGLTVNDDAQYVYRLAWEERP